MNHPLVVNKKIDTYDVNIARPTKWGNPYPARWYDNRAECVARYRCYLLTRPELLSALGELRGLRLGCVCAPSLCHGDVLARMANNPWTVKAYARPR